MQWMLAMGSPPVLAKVDILVPPLLALVALTGLMVLWKPLAGWVAAVNRKLLIAASVVVFAVFAVASLMYLESPVWLDHGEPYQAIMTQLFLEGRALHPLPEAAERYALMYGPNAYVLGALSFKVLGAGVFAAKLPGIVVAAVNAGLLAWILRRSGGRWGEVAIGMGYFLATCLVFRQDGFWFKADPLILLGVILALGAALLAGPWTASVMVGAAIGACVNLKAHTLIYFLPMLGLLMPRMRAGHWVALVVTGAVIAVMPFLVFKSASIHNYLVWVNSVKEAGFTAGNALDTLSHGVLLSLPLVILTGWSLVLAPARMRSLVRGHRLFVACCVVAGVVIVAPAARWGAGSHHLLPFAPVVAWLLVKLLRVAHEVGTTRVRLGQFGEAWLMVTLAAIFGLGAAKGVVLMQKLIAGRAYAEEVTADVDYAAAHFGEGGGEIAMGAGANASYPATWYRSELVFRGGAGGGDYWLDTCAALDMRKCRIEVSAATIEALKEGRSRVWLIPRGDAPFTINSNLFEDGSGDGLIYGEEFRKTFVERYELTEQTRFFDVWTWRPPHSAAATHEGGGP